MMTTEKNTTLLTVAEAAEFLDVKPGAIYSAIRRNRITPVPSSSGRLQFRFDDIDHYQQEYLGRIGRPSLEKR